MRLTVCKGVQQLFNFLCSGFICLEIPPFHFIGVLRSDFDNFMKRFPRFSRFSRFYKKIEGRFLWVLCFQFLWITIKFPENSSFIWWYY